MFEDGWPPVVSSTVVSATEAELFVPPSPVESIVLASTPLPKALAGAGACVVGAEFSVGAKAGGLVLRSERRAFVTWVLVVGAGGAGASVKAGPVFPIPQAEFALGGSEAKRKSPPEAPPSFVPAPPSGSPYVFMFIVGLLMPGPAMEPTVVLPVDKDATTRLIRSWFQ